MGQGRAQASPLMLRGITDPRADEKPAEARFRGCESERPINSKRDRYDSRDSGKASVSFLRERGYRKGCDIFSRRVGDWRPMWFCIGILCEFCNYVAYCKLIATRTRVFEIMLKREKRHGNRRYSKSAVISLSYDIGTLTQFRSGLSC